MMMIAAKSICCNNNMQAFFIILYRRRTMELLKEEPSQEETTTDAFTFTQDDSNAFILTQESAFTTVIEEDDDGERRHTRRRRKNKKKQRDRVYEQLGAPCLLYRHGAHPSHPDYVLVEDNETGPSPPWAAVGSKRRFGALDPALETEMIHASIQRRHRTQARWYYPMDYPVLKSSRLWGQPDHSEEEASDEEENDRQKQKKRKGKDESEVEDSNNNIINNNNDIPQRKTKRPELHAKLAPLRKADPFGRFDKSVVDKKFEKSRVFEGVEEARKYLLETSFEDDNELDHLPLKEYINRKRVYLGELQKEHHKSILQGYRKYDHVSAL